MGRKHNISLNMLRSSDTTISPSMAAPITSREIDTSEMDKASIHLNWVAGPEGTFVVEVKNAEADAWYTLDFGTPITITASDSDIQILMQEMPFIKMRLRYTNSSGNGTLNAYLNTKSVGA